MIIFEIVHETALTLEPDSIIADILRPNGPQPFEFMQHREVDDIEELRTPTGNLMSGASFGASMGNSPTVIKYFLDQGSIGLLANVLSKLNHNYYDGEDQINETIVAIKYRTPEFIAKTAKYILTVLKCEDIPSDEALLHLVLDREGIKERILHTPLLDIDIFLKQEATDPMKADEIITLVKGLHKKVFTVFGYSALGYEDPEKLEQALRKDFANISPDNYIINIGATEEGIGMAYKIAKKMGFKTIGIVSTSTLRNLQGATRCLR